METTVARPISPLALWFSLMGGALAWLAHFLIAYVIAEWGCLAGLGEVRWLGLTIVAWLLIALSVAMLLASIAAAVVAYRCSRRAPEHGAHSIGAPGFAGFMTRTGFIMNVLFALIIAVESIPIVYYWNHC